MSGNIFKNETGPLTNRIATADVATTVSFIEKITGLDFTAEQGEDSKPVKWLGTTGRKESVVDGTFEIDNHPSIPTPLKLFKAPSCSS